MMTGTRQMGGKGGYGGGEPFRGDVYRYQPPRVDVFIVYHTCTDFLEIFKNNPEEAVLKCFFIKQVGPNGVLF